MSTIITSRNYQRLRNNENSSYLLAAKDDIFRYEITLRSLFIFTSSQSIPLEVVSGNTIRILGSTWGAYGFIVGDTLALSIGAGTPENVTVQEINGDVMTFTTSPTILTTNIGEVFPGGGNDPFTVNHQSTQHVVKYEVLFNLIANSANGGINSLIDGEVNKIEFDVSGLNVSDQIAGVVVGNKSGGAIIDSLVERIADTGAVRNYKITITSANFLSFDEGDLTRIQPYQANETIKTFARINAYRQPTNPNSVLVRDDVSQLGNVGWYNENYNQGNNPFTIDSLTFEDAQGNPLSGIDYAQPTKVKCKVLGTGTFQNNYLAVGYHVPFDDRYKNNSESWLDNTFFTFKTAALTDFFGLGGAELEIDNVTFDESTANECEIEFDLVPNAAFTQYFEQLQDGDRFYRLSLTLQTTAGSATNNDATTLLLFEDELTASPAVGQIASEVDSLTFLIHPEVDTAAGVISPVAMTEDDLLVKGLFKLNKADNYDSINASFRVVRQSDGAFFNLWSRNIVASNFPLTVDNKRLFNFVEQLGYNLPNPGRNVLSLIFNGTEDSTTYDVEFRHTLLLSWRYWVARPNALADFLDISLSNNGLNDEWVRYAQSGFDFVFRLEFIKDGVADFYNAPITIEDYDSTTVTSVIDLTDTNDNVLPGIIPNNTTVIRAQHDAGTAWDPSTVWGWLASRPKENEPRVLLSTVWPWSSVNLPLQPLSGDTEAELTFPSSDIAQVRGELPAGLINQETTIVARIASPLTSKCKSPMDWLFETIRTDYPSKAARFQFWEDFMSGAESFILPKPNGLCCPECEVSEGLFLYAFSSEVLMDASLDGLTICERINTDTWTVGAEDYRFVSEVNQYFGVNQTILANQLSATFSDAGQLHDAVLLLLDNGLAISCDATQMKISRLAT
jgi:hypothetical protein